MKKGRKRETEKERWREEGSEGEKAEKKKKKIKLLIYDFG